VDNPIKMGYKWQMKGEREQFLCEFNSIYVGNKKELIGTKFFLNMPKGVKGTGT
jgi:hypothetical protein